jgi:hypothetical protein
MKLIWFNLFICQLLFRYILTESETPALHIQLNPPEQNTKDIIDALKDLERIEMELNQGINEDFEYEKSKLIEIQKARIHDIVHGSFISLQALIPNPIKSEIRQTIRNKLINKEQPSYESDNNNYDTKRSENAVKPDDTQREINKIKQNLFLSSPFGLHCRDYRECNGEVMQTIVDEILKNGHSVYLTDFYKAFTLDPNKKDKKSIDLLSGFVGQFKDILDEEIRLYKPNLIICFGNDATNALLTKKVEYGTIQTYKASIKEYKVLSLPHISGANNACWKKILNGERCTANNKAMYINEKISNTLKQVQ